MKAEIHLLKSNLDYSLSAKENKMDWIKCTVFTTSSAIESVCGRLALIDINGTQVEDEADFLVFLKENTAFWDLVDDELIEKMKGETRVIFYLPDDEYLNKKLSEVKNELSELKLFDINNEYGRLDLETSVTNEEDWANNWKKYFKPINIGKKILVCPEWENCDNKEGRIVFKINPGMTFGTGTHHSTRMCIELLEDIIKENDSVLDVGCGSGILSIISLLLGAKDAFALDIDPNAIHIAYENALLNGIGKDKYYVTSGNVLSDKDLQNEIKQKKYNVVVANIIADVIIALAPMAKDYIKENGTFICSGIILPRLEEVEAELKKYFKIEKTIKSADWAAIYCKLL